MSQQKTLWRRVKAKPIFFSVALLIVGGGLAGTLLQSTLSDTQSRSSRVSSAARKSEKGQGQVVLACPGRVEGISEVVNLGAEMDGVLKEVRVQEGQKVKAGETLALIDCGDWAAELQAARAAAESARQSRVRLVRGSRDEERRLALDQKAREAAVLEQTRLQHERMSKLFATGDVSQETVEKTKRDLAVAEASFNAALNHLALVNAPPLPEDLAKAEAETNAADERVNVIGEKLKRCAIKAPISGTVLRVHLKAGESVATVFPQPVISLVDDSRLRVRAEVDERDVGRIHLGQPVTVIAPAFSEQSFIGQVSRLAAQMGRKKVRTGDPAEKSDRDVLEVLVDLAETDARLVIGLRVTVQFLGR